MIENFRKTNGSPFLFPTVVASAVFGGWVGLMSFETCILQRFDPKFDCWSSLQFAAIFSCIGAALAGLMALLARVLLNPFLPFTSLRPEGVSALIASLLLMFVSYSVLRWEITVGHIGIQLFGWLAASLVISGGSLMLVKHFSVSWSGS